MAYFSMWQPHGNRVSKTRFITLINLKEEPPEHQRRTQGKKKKKNPGRMRPIREELIREEPGPHQELIREEQIGRAHV